MIDWVVNWRETRSQRRLAGDPSDHGHIVYLEDQINCQSWYIIRLWTGFRSSKMLVFNWHLMVVFTFVCCDKSSWIIRCSFDILSHIALQICTSIVTPAVPNKKKKKKKKTTLKRFFLHRLKTNQTFWLLRKASTEAVSNEAGITKNIPSCASFIIQ